MALVKGQSVFVPQTGTREKYRLGKDFERSLVVTMCATPSLYARVGHAMHTDGFEEPEARLLFSAIRSLADDFGGAGPSSRSTVVARIKQWVGEGRYDVATLRTVLRFIEFAEDAGMPPAEEMGAAIAEQLQRIEGRLALEFGMTTFQKREDMGPVVERLERAQRIGLVERATSTPLGPASFARMAAAKNVERLPTGIMEVDTILAGGIEVGTITTYLGASSSGKSQMLVQSATAAALRGFHVLYATLEMSEAMTNFRVTANLTAEFVQLFGPMLYSRNPVRTVKPRHLVDLPATAFGLPDSATTTPEMAQGLDMLTLQAGAMFEQALQAQAQQAQKDQVVALLLEKYLNYTPNELDLKGESRKAINEALGE